MWGGAGGGERALLGTIHHGGSRAGFFYYFLFLPSTERERRCGRRRSVATFLEVVADHDVMVPLALCRV